ncbi:MAG: hypothetical protein D6746_04180 [Bacteroidetes bacterium]|nr:MAG: hypothetical protein D6746_04180 [Bacteroidota bacterium]
MSFLGDLTDSIVGPDNARASNPLEALGGLIAEPGKFFDRSLSMATLFSPAGDGLDLLGAVRGRDLFTGRELHPWERLASASGIAVLGAGVLGAALLATRYGPPPAALLQAGVGQSIISSERYVPDDLFSGVNEAVRLEELPSPAPGVRSFKVGMDVSDVGNEELTRLNATADSLAIRFGTVNQQTSRILATATYVGTENQPLTYNGLARIFKIKPGRVRNEFTALMAEIADRLVTEVGPHARHFASITDTTARETYKTSALAWHMAGFNWIMSGSAKGYVKLEGFEPIKRAWQRVRTGSGTEKTRLAARKMISDVFVQFAGETSWITHPELYINPMVGIDTLTWDKDLGRLSVNLKVIKFDHVPLHQMTKEDFNNRLMILSTTHPASMVNLFADNIRKLLDDVTLDPERSDWLGWFSRTDKLPPETLPEPKRDLHDVIREFRDWYTLRRKQAVDEARNLRKSHEEVIGQYLGHLSTSASSTKALIVSTAILSSSQDWDTNFIKAKHLLKAILDNPDRGPTWIHNHLTESEEFRQQLFEAAVREAEAEGTKPPKSPEEINMAKFLSRDQVAGVMLVLALDNPFDYFKPNTTGELTLEAIREIMDENLKGMTDRAALAELAAKRKTGPAHVSQKIPSFAHSIWESTNRDVKLQAKKLALLIAGEPFDQQQLRDRLPLVIDRHAFKIAVGASIVPGSQLSSNKGLYDQIAQAFRLVAAEIGVVDGAPLTPTELQALTWVRVRTLGHYTDEFARPLPIREPPTIRKKTIELPDGSTEDVEEVIKGRVLAPRSVLGHTPFLERPISSVAGMLPGAGPDMVLSPNPLIQFVTGEMVPVFPDYTKVGADLVYDGKYFMDTAEIADPILNAPTTKSVEKGTVSIGLDANGNPIIQSATFDPPIRGRWATRAVRNGRYVTIRKRPRMVDDVETEFKRIVDSNFNAANPEVPENGGGALYPPTGLKLGKTVGERLGWNDQGPILRLTAMAGLEGGPHKRHDRILDELARIGVVPVSYDDLPGHKGLSTVWQDDMGFKTWSRTEAREILGDNYADYAALDVEPRQARIVRLASSADLRKARQLLRSTYPQGEADPVRWGIAYALENAPDRPFRVANGTGAPTSDVIVRAFKNLGPNPLEANLMLSSLEVDLRNQLRWMTDNGFQIVLVDEPPSYDELRRSVENMTIPVTGRRFNHPFNEVPVTAGEPLTLGHVAEASLALFGVVPAGPDADFQAALQTWAQLFDDGSLPGLASLARRPPDVPADVVPPPEVWRDLKVRGLVPSDRPDYVHAIYEDEVPDVTYYVDAPNEAPDGTVGFWEHHYDDPVGRHLVVMSVSGENNRSNVIRVYTDADPDALGKYVEPVRSKKVTPARSYPFELVETKGVKLFDGKVELRYPEGSTFSRYEKGLYTAKLDGNRIDDFWIYVPLDEPGKVPQRPVVALGDRHLLDEFPRSRVVKVSRFRDAKGEVMSVHHRGSNWMPLILHLPKSSGGRVDAVLFSKAEDILADILGAPTSSGYRIVPEGFREASRSQILTAQEKKDLDAQRKAAKAARLKETHGE